MGLADRCDSSGMQLCESCDCNDLIELPRSRTEPELVGFVPFQEVEDRAPALDPFFNQRAEQDLAR